MTLRGAHGVCEQIRKVTTRGVCQIIIELPAEYYKQAVQMFDNTAIWMEPAPALLTGRPYAVVDQPAEGEQPPATARPEKSPYGQVASLLYRHGFFLNPHVLRALGTDNEYIAWVQRQPSAISGQFSEYLESGEGRCIAAHNRRIAGGAGTAIKNEYAVIPLTYAEHGAQTDNGYSALGGHEAFDKLRAAHVTKWAAGRLAEAMDVESMGFADPTKVLAWATAAGIAHYLPRGYREAA